MALRCAFEVFAAVLGFSTLFAILFMLVPLLMSRTWEGPEWGLWIGWVLQKGAVSLPRPSVEKAALLMDVAQLG